MKHPLNTIKTLKLAFVTRTASHWVSFIRLFNYAFLTIFLLPFQAVNLLFFPSNASVINKLHHKLASHVLGLQIKVEGSPTKIKKRKLARFDYEVKGKQYYDGTESNVGLSATNSPVKGLEYVFHTEKERSRDEIFKNHRYFVKHSGKNHMVKLESRAQGKVDFKYKSAEVRAKLPIGKKFSISAGAIYRTHERPYGYNPVEIWLNETNESGQIVNPWYTLGFMYGYDDIYYTQQDSFGNETSDWYWIDEEGETVAYTDLQFRDTVFAELMNRYNHEVWDDLDAFGVLSPVLGFDYYHYKNNFWLHAYGSYLLPYHKYVKGDEDFSYLNRNNWGLGGLMQDSELEQWEDYQAGVVFGWKLSKSIGVFVEGEYTKFWDSKIYNGSVGLNITLK